MAQSKFIQSVTDAAKGRPKSTQWYKDKIKEFGEPGAQDLIRDGKRNNKPFYGRLNMFFYDPKFKKTLPYYDTFPLVLPLQGFSGGFVGMNFHYLSPMIRFRVLQQLVDYSNNTNFDESTKLVVDYSRLKSLSIIKPTLHRYLAGQTKSQFRRIDADEFMVAALLPVQNLRKLVLAQFGQIQGV